MLLCQQQVPTVSHSKQVKNFLIIILTYVAIRGNINYTVNKCESFLMSSVNNLLISNL
jgi:hypothetical protein